MSEVQQCHKSKTVVKLFVKLCTICRMAFTLFKCINLYLFL